MRKYKKGRLQCSILYAFYNGVSCENVPEVLSDTDGKDDETTDVNQILTTDINNNATEDGREEEEENSEQDIHLNQPGPSTRSKGQRHLNFIQTVHCALDLQGKPH